MEVVFIIVVFVCCWIIKLSLNIINSIFSKTKKQYKIIKNKNYISYYCDNCSIGYNYQNGNICKKCGKFMKIIPTKAKKGFRQKHKNPKK